MQKKQKIFQRWGLRPETPETVPLQIFGYAPETNYVFALLIFMPPKFFLMLRMKSIIFNQNKQKLSWFCKKIKFFECWGLCPQTPNGFWWSFQTPEHSPCPHRRFLITRLILNVCCSYFQVLESYKEKLLT